MLTFCSLLGAVTGEERPSGFRAATAPGVVFETVRPRHSHVRDALPLYAFPHSDCATLDIAKRADFAAHMKSDWHKHNLKLKSEGKTLLSKDEFLEWQILSSS
jgi:hypothetical protein